MIEIQKSRHPEYPLWATMPHQRMQDMIPWAEQYDCMRIGNVLYFPSEQIAALFLLRWQ